MILVPTVLAVYFGISNHKNKLYAEELEKQVNSVQLPKMEHITGVSPDTVITVPTYEYQTKYPDLYVENAEFVQPDTDKPVIYLTFDDGPSRNTTQVLDILKANNIKATFFWLTATLTATRICTAALWRKATPSAFTPTPTDTGTFTTPSMTTLPTLR